MQNHLRLCLISFCGATLGIRKTKLATDLSVELFHFPNLALKLQTGLLLLLQLLDKVVYVRLGCL